MKRFATLTRHVGRLSSIQGLSCLAPIPLSAAISRHLHSGITTKLQTSRLPSFRPQPSSTFIHFRSLSSLPTDGTELTMPALSPTMDKGGITSWLKKEGDKVSPGDSIAEIETDKATLEWELTEAGYIAKIIHEAGSKDLAVGTVVAIMVDDEKDIAAYKNYNHEAGTTSPPVEKPVVEPKTDTVDMTSYPEHIVVGFPALSPTMEIGGLGSWVKKEGDYVTSGDTICSIVTDKATNDFECLEEGYVAKILVHDGTEEIPVGAPIAVIVENKESISAFADFKPASSQPGETTKPAPPVETAPPVLKPPTPPAPVKQQETRSAGRVVASPYAKKLASDSNISLEGVPGTGPGGRIVEADVRDLIARGGASSRPPLPPSEGPYLDVPLTQIRQRIAERLTESKQTIPHYYLTVDCVVDELIELRKSLNAKLEKQGNKMKLSVNDFIIKAAALALRDVPGVNSSWQGDSIRQYTAADINVAVQTPAGLMVPIVRNAETIGLQLISQEVKTLAEKAKTGALRPEEFMGGTFTISNLGMFGIKQFCAIINPPQAAILAVGTTQTQLAKRTNTNELLEKTVMSCTLSCDHRVIDGAVGAQWLKEFKQYLEQPSMMLL